VFQFLFALYRGQRDPLKSAIRAAILSSSVLTSVNSIFPPLLIIDSQVHDPCYPGVFNNNVIVKNLFAVAIFILFPTAAWTRIIAAYTLFFHVRLAAFLLVFLISRDS